MTWIDVNTQFQQSTPYKVQRTEILLQDEIIDLDDLTLLSDSSIFRL